MNRINYFQQGGQATQQNIQEQVVALVQAAMQGDQKATQTVNQIMEAAQKGDLQALLLAQMIQQVAKQMKNQATTAKWGSKLQYIKSLKFKKGGKTCPACMLGGGDLVNGKYPKHWTAKQRMEYDRNHPTDESKAANENNKARQLEKKKQQSNKQENKLVKKRYFGGWL